ncbi:hypothetical protein ZHAS_00009689 [Anopheles sinensis]|uniref:Uncharacterized protein n=1 Tax=Anopheles sinensis TaxID=74873 RepID=A0A084VV53_ANOSI|nr:hypothetical protein ZHAS_00009689 [Anopheles sinensis]
MAYTQDGQRVTNVCRVHPVHLPFQNPAINLVRTVIDPIKSKATTRMTMARSALCGSSTVRFLIYTVGRSPSIQDRRCRRW